MSEDNDKKRPSEDDDTQSFVKKRKPLNELSEEGPLTQEDVVYFQKEAIWRQMRVYKQKFLLLSKDLEKFKQQYELNEKKLNILDSWYEQIINLFGDRESDQELNDSLLVKLTDESSVDEILEKRRSQLLKILTPINSQYNKNISDDGLVKKIEKLNYELLTIKSNNEALNKLKSNLEENVEELRNELTNLVKEKERTESKSLKRVDESLNGNDKKEEEEVAVKSEMPNNINNEEFENITIELNELKSANQLIKQQLDAITEKYNMTQHENLALVNRLNNLSGADLENNEIYLDLKNSNIQLTESLDSLQKVNESTANKINELESNQNNIKNLIAKDILEENEQLKNQLNKNETDLIRIRTTRDELLSKQTILKSELENKQTNEELNKLNKILNKRIESLENVSNKEVETIEYNDLSKEELIKRVNMLQMEIKEIEVAFQETREVSIKKLTSAIDQENLIKKLTIEKAKADQKYFSSMRSKDAISAENKLLKLQINKSQELINKFNELEKNYQSKIDILTKTINDYKMIKQTSIEENLNLKEINKSMTTKKGLIEAELKKLKSKLDENLAQLSQANSELSIKDLSINKLEAKLKSTDSLLKKYKTNNTSSILQEDEKQLEALRSIAKCSVCSKNWKDTVITVCGHVFCHGCTQERLAARLRRCPSCNKGFSSNDLLSIHL